MKQILPKDSDYRLEKLRHKNAMELEDKRHTHIMAELAMIKPNITHFHMERGA